MHRTLDEVKKWVYLILAFLGFAGSLAGLLQGHSASTVTVSGSLLRIAGYLMFSCAWLFCAWLLTRAPIPIHVAERVVFSFFSCCYILWLLLSAFAGVLAGSDLQAQLAFRGYWQVLALSVGAFLSYDFYKGLAFSSGLYLVTLVTNLAQVLVTGTGGVAAVTAIVINHMKLAGLIILIGLLGYIKEQWLVTYGEAEAMRRLANLDPLTSVSNRRHLDEALLRTMHRGPQPFTVIMFDIDSFKEINDTYGHITGDRVLVTTANIVRNVVRKEDAFGRWGGEEFLVVCPGTDLSTGWQIAERLRRAIASHTFDDVGEITASFGVAEYRPGESPEELLARADNVLYLAKLRGKNRVEISPNHPLV